MRTLGFEVVTGEEAICHLEVYCCLWGLWRFYKGFLGSVCDQTDKVMWWNAVFLFLCLIRICLHVLVGLLVTL